MKVLIDGYNLIHAMGLIPANGAGPTGLERARLKLIGRLHGSLGKEAARVTVVFDAAHAPVGVADACVIQDIHLQFARHGEADDLIESLIASHSAPQSLTVVSDDRRIKNAGHARHCRVLGCEAFLKELDAAHRAELASHRVRPEKPQALSDQELARWEQAFADEKTESALRKISEPHEFLE